MQKVDEAICGVMTDWGFTLPLSLMVQAATRVEEQNKGRLTAVWPCI
jgi:hypothetical protein